MRVRPSSVLRYQAGHEGLLLDGHEYHCGCPVGCLTGCCPNCRAQVMRPSESSSRRSSGMPLSIDQKQNRMISPLISYSFLVCWCLLGRLRDQHFSTSRCSGSVPDWAAVRVKPSDSNVPSGVHDLFYDSCQCVASQHPCQGHRTTISHGLRLRCSGGALGGASRVSACLIRQNST